MVDLSLSTSTAPGATKRQPGEFIASNHKFSAALRHIRYVRKCSNGTLSDVLTVYLYPAAVETCITISYYSEIR